MKTKNILNRILFAVLLTITIAGCSSYDEPVIEALDVNREFAPVALTTRVRNQTTVELNWTINENANSYVLEFSGDDPTFGNIVRTLEVTSDELPVQVQLEGETVYSIRLKVISNRGLEDSKWALGEVTTLTEQIMLPSEPGDIKALEATLRWVPNSNVTQIVLTPGDIVHTITAQEKIDGVATVTGLSSETDYSALLLNNTKTRGSAEFTTGIDVGDNTLVLPSDDLFQMIADAAPGDILLLEQGDYTAQTGTITLDKSITIQGLRVDFKPKLKVSFEIIAGAADVNLIDLDVEGSGTDTSVMKHFLEYKGASNYNSLLVSGCNIHDFATSFIRSDVTDLSLQSLIVENSILTNIFTDGGDFIDFRKSNVLNVTVRTSTFNNCAPGRDFFRLDDAGSLTQTGLTCNVLLESCTLYGVSNTADRVLYVRFQLNKIIVKNNLFAETTAYYSNQGRTDPTPTFLNNNYFNAPGFYTTNIVYDTSGTYTDLDPGFADVAAGNFKVSNQTLLDNQVGDPRWLIQ